MSAAIEVLTEVDLSDALEEVLVIGRKGLPRSPVPFNPRLPLAVSRPWMKQLGMTYLLDDEGE